MNVHGSMILYCDYVEYKPETYKGVYLSHINEEIERFNSGNMLDDIRSACLKYKDNYIIFSGSIDNYFLDSNIKKEDIWSLYEELGINYTVNDF